MFLGEDLDGDAGDLNQDRTAYMLVAVGCPCVEVEVAVNAEATQPTKIHKECGGCISNCCQRP